MSHGHGGHGEIAGKDAAAAKDQHDEHGAHGHGGHGHGGHGASASGRALTAAVVLTGSFMAVEAAAGIWTGGLALLADAAHMLADAASLGLALFANRWAERPRTAKSTFGHRRGEVLAAFVNGIALAVTAIGIVIEAVERYQAPREVRALGMLIAAGVGLLVNLLVAKILAGSSKDNLNVRAAFAHVAMDAVGSIGAMTAAALILAFGWERSDSVVSIGIAGLVAYSGWRVLRETTSILLEAAPAHIDVDEVERAIRQCPGVGDVHDLHVWRISDKFDALTVHVTLADGAHGVDVCRYVARKLAEDFGLDHVTVQPEAPRPVEIVGLRLSRNGQVMKAR
ncbi:MAG TPA: cation diffusion facilitator family transporter [Polyangiaceae bacterium]